MLNYGYSEEGTSGSVRDLTLWKRILTYSGRYKGALALAIMLAVFALVGIVLWKYPSLREEPIGSTRLGPGKTMKPRELASKSHSTQRD